MYGFLYQSSRQFLQNQWMLKLECCKNQFWGHENNSHYLWKIKFECDFPIIHYSIPQQKCIDLVNTETRRVFFKFLSPLLSLLSLSPKTFLDAKTNFCTEISTYISHCVLNFFSFSLKFSFKGLISSD